MSDPQEILRLAPTPELPEDWEWWLMNRRLGASRQIGDGPKRLYDYCTQLTRGQLHIEFTLEFREASMALGREAHTIRSKWAAALEGPGLLHDVCDAGADRVRCKLGDPAEVLPEESPRPIRVVGWKRPHKVPPEQTHFPFLAGPSHSQTCAQTGAPSQTCAQTGADSAAAFSMGQPLAQASARAGDDRSNERASGGVVCFDWEKIGTFTATELSDPNIQGRVKELAREVRIKPGNNWERDTKLVSLAAALSTRNERLQDWVHGALKDVRECCPRNSAAYFRSCLIDRMVRQLDFSSKDKAQTVFHKLCANFPRPVRPKADDGKPA